MLAGVAGSAIGASAVMGAATNAVNGTVSPLYFETMLGFEEEVWRAAVAQGLFEGLLWGVFLALAFTVGTGIITRASCTYKFAGRHLIGVSAGALACWMAGGLIAMALAALSPEFYRNAFMGVPDAFGPILAYAWVGGSIWGLQLGAILSIALGLVFLRRNWRGIGKTVRIERRPSADA